MKISPKMFWRSNLKEIFNSYAKYFPVNSSKNVIIDKDNNMINWNQFHAFLKDFNLININKKLSIK